ncbi:MAG: STAS domain-containing protein [Deltaproteobacteria bacterium]|nr:STAS domain-containing protein [Deltaproteobacteria bacterium]
MNVQAQQEEGILTVAVEGKVDGATAPELESRLVEWLDQGETKIILDLQEVYYISSAGLRVVLMGAKRLQNKGRLVLAGLKPEVKEIFEMAGFDTILDFYDQPGAARDALLPG